MVKVVKRAERGRPVQQAAGSTNPEPPSRDGARALATRVREWVSEFEQARPVRLQELRRRLGWQELGGDGLPVQAVSDSVESE
ncbi:MAG TPA: hypothetical protein VNZ44_05045 [Pyrinomonadaceae bacterium]|nr:hypothetical protein [Pyrinomonadaceae bacterium]